MELAALWCNTVRVRPNVCNHLMPTSYFLLTCFISLLHNLNTRCLVAEFGCDRITEPNLEVIRLFSRILFVSLRCIFASLEAYDQFRNRKTDWNFICDLRKQQK